MPDFFLMAGSWLVTKSLKNKSYRHTSYIIALFFNSRHLYHLEKCLDDFFLLLKFFNRDMTELWCGRMDHESLGVWEILDRAVIMTPHKKHKKKEKEEEGSCGQKLIVGHATLYMSDRMKHIFSIWFFNFTWKKD